jgi:hypothetical protein
VTEMRCVLGLFEGVVTGAADGYAAWLRNRHALCFTLVPAWPTASRICTTPTGLGYR